MPFLATIMGSLKQSHLTYTLIEFLRPPIRSPRKYSGYTQSSRVYFPTTHVGNPAFRSPTPMYNIKHSHVCAFDPALLGGGQKPTHSMPWAYLGTH